MKPWILHTSFTFFIHHAFNLHSTMIKNVSSKLSSSRDVVPLINTFLQNNHIQVVEKIQLFTTGSGTYGGT